MSYYPILTAPYCMGQTTLYNFPPNNWELSDRGLKYVSLTYIQDNQWHSRTLDTLDNGQCKSVKYNDLNGLMPEDCLPLLSLSAQQLPKISNELPSILFNQTITPNHRSSLALNSRFAKTSYLIPEFVSCLTVFKNFASAELLVSMVFVNGLPAKIL